MNTEEKAELRKLLNDRVKHFQEKGSFKVLDLNIRLDEDRGHTTTEAEILVFGLPREFLPQLHIAWDAYEVFIGISSPYYLHNERMGELVIKARDICPLAERLNISYEFKECLDFPDWFAWFAKEFLKIPTRGAYAFWQKQAFNTEQLINFDDDQENGLLYVAAPPPF